MEYYNTQLSIEAPEWTPSGKASKESVDEEVPEWFNESDKFITLDLVELSKATRLVGLLR